MADEFAKGLAVFTAAGLGWMVLSGWYTTPSFEGLQLVGEAPANVDVYGQIALVAREALFWFAITGALAFWVLIPAFRQVRAAARGEPDTDAE